MNAMKTGVTAVAGALALLALSPAAQAHKAWLLPSQTVLSSEGGWITVDGAVSNDLFYFNHNPLRLDGLSIRAPDGSTVQPQNVATGKYRTTFDLQLQKAGTYRLALASESANARFEVNGEQKRARGNAASIASQIPAGAKNVEISYSSRTVESFVTVGKPTDVSAARGKGLELVAVTHPNDLYAGEAATFRFVLDGKPVAGVPVEIVAGGSRYRDAQNEMKMKTDAKGEIQVTWPAAGMYWLEAVSESAAGAQAGNRSATYVGTFEVLTQ
jgi:uncharacterized GH25 family protein